MLEKFVRCLIVAVMVIAGLPTVLFAQFEGHVEHATFTGKEETCDVKFELAEHLIMVKVRIGESKKTYDFMLDTGTATNVISETLAEKIHAKKIGERMGNDSTGKEQKISFYALDSITLGSCRLENGITAAIDLQTLEKLVGRNIDGIIGANFLSMFRVTIDYAHQRINLCWSDEPLKGTYLIKAVDRAVSPLIAIPITVDGQTLSAIIDTGAADIALPMTFLQKLDYPKEEVLHSIGSMSSGMNGQAASIILARINDLQIVDTHLRRYPVSSVAVARGLLGKGFLARYLITIDYDSYTIALTPVDNTPSKTNSFGIGLGIFSNGLGGLEVCGLWANSPAAKAGIQPGDLILEINGKKVGKLSMNKLMKFTRDDSVTSIDLLIKSKEDQRRVTLQKVNLFPEIPPEQGK